MAKISQLAAELDLVGVEGNPFAVDVNVTLTDSSNNPLPFSDLSSPTVDITYNGQTFSAGAPTVTVPSSGVIQVAWSGTQTTAIAASGTCEWSLSVSFLGTEVALLAGTVKMEPDTTPGAANSTTADLAVSVGTATASLSILLGTVTSGGGGGGGTVNSVTAGDSTVTIGGTSTDPTVKVTANTFDAHGAAATETSRAQAAEALLAPLASPALTGTPTAPTKAPATNNTDLATTAYADAAVAVETTRAEAAEATLATSASVTAEATARAAADTAETTRAEAAEALLAPLASPALTGTPTAPTKTALTSNTDIATTAYADSAVGVEATARASAITSAVATETTRAEAAEALLAPLASPALTGTPTAPTKAPATNNTDIATTAYADAATAVEATRATTAEALLAPKASPALTGTPTAPTQSALTNNTDIATTAYADAATGVEKARALAAEALLAPLASPHLTGTPLAPTAAHGINNTQVATTAFVLSEMPWYNALDYGIVADGSTDDTSAWNTLFATVATAGGGTIYLPGGKTSLCSGVLTPVPFTSPAPALRITGAGSNRGDADVSTGASRLDLRFNGNAGTNLGKIDCRGAAFFELDHLTIKSGGTDDFLFLYATNTTMYVHDNLFSGHSTNSGSSCVQDVIQLGANPGVLGDIGTGAADAPFQGYGTVIERNFFNRIRSAVVYGCASNGVVTRDNTVNNLCGGDTTHGAFTLVSSAFAPTSNIFAGNLIEVSHYPFAWVITNGNQNQMIGNSLFDGVTGTNKTVKDAGNGNRFYATAIDGSFTDYPDVGSVQVLTSGTTFTPTASGKYLVVAVGGGGAGASGATPSSAIAQAGSGGGGQGDSQQAFMDLVSGTAYTYSIGAAGTAAGTTAAGGNPGLGGGTASGSTTFAGPAFTLAAVGGAHGNPALASSTVPVSGGQPPAFFNLLTVTGQDAIGNNKGLQSPNGWGGGTFMFSTLCCSGGAPLGFGAGGGGGGAAASTTKGGTGGAAAAFGTAAAGTGGGSGTINGTAGANAAATSYGGGGGGGGAGATASGTGGGGGNGAPGVIYVIGPYPAW